MPESPETRPETRRTFWGWCRCSLRWARIALLASVLLVLGLLTLLRWVGLPDFIRTQIAADLLRRGVVADVRSLHFHWFRGIVAQDLRIAWGGTNGPHITIDEADLDITPPPWNGGRDLLRGLSVLRGTLRLPLVLSNQPPRQLRVDEVAADIRFLPGDAWEVRRLAAQVMGVQLELRASLTNVAALRRQPTPSDPAAERRRLEWMRTVVEHFESCSFSTPPRLEIGLSLDGQRWWSAEGEAFLKIDRASSPQGSLQDARLLVRSRAPTQTNAPATLTAVLELGQFAAPGRLLSTCSARVRLIGPPAPALPTQAVWQVTAGRSRIDNVALRGLSLEATNHVLQFGAEPAATRVLTEGRLGARTLRATAGEGPSYTATNVQAAITARHGLAATPPESLDLDARCDGPSGPPGTVARTRVKANVRRREPADPVPPDLAWWSSLWPWTGQVAVDLDAVRSPRLEVERFSLTADWSAPELTVTRLAAELRDGNLQGSGRLDVPARDASLSLQTTFDLHVADPLLGPRSRENFTRYQWTNPPRFTGEVRAVLPRWTDRHPDWDGEVKPTLRLGGRFQVGEGSFKGIPFDTAESSLAFDGENWTLPDLRTTRPEGRQAISLVYNEETQEYRIDARGQVHPPVLKPVLGPQSGDILDLFDFREPVTAEVTVWGPWSHGTRQAIQGTIQATNFVFRGQRFDHLNATTRYTNHFLVAAPLQLSRDGGNLLATGVGYHFTEDQVWITNAVNSIDPAVVAAAISPGFEEKLAPYRFDHPPTVRVDGTIHPRDTATANLTFDVAGGPFHFWRLSAEDIRTQLLWTGHQMALKDIQGRFYSGEIRGEAEFDLRNPEDAPYQFSARVREARLGDLLREATPGKTNVAEGTFDLNLDITSARTSDLNSWSGSGQAKLRDGLLWDVPIFGLFSPLLNAASPGLGNNRAERADATFSITNGVIHTRDMVIACPPAPLFYRGTLDFDQRVRAKVEAQILSDLAGIGPIMGLLLRPLTKLFEFRVTGTLADIEAEPLYIPRFLLLPLEAGRFLFRGIFRGGGGVKAGEEPPADENADPNAPIVAPVEARPAPTEVPVNRPQ